MSTTIDGQSTKPIPATVQRGINKGEPKRVALSKGPKPVSTVKV